jgi:hypothetical protein
VEKYLDCGVACDLCCYLVCEKYLEREKACDFMLLIGEGLG